MANKFEKEVLTLDKKIQLLKDRWLKFKDETKAKEYIRHTWYYRLSWYFKHFQWRDSTKWVDDFIDWITFEDIYKTYIFDRKLRLLVLDAIEKIEISLKSVINNYMSELDWCYWYLNTNNFYLWHKTIHKYGKMIIKFNSKKYDKDSEIAKNFFEKYDEEYLPSWKLFEELTIWEISTIYRILLPIHKEKISKTYIVNFKDLSTWIVLINKLRNISAHHWRLWNRNYNIKLIIKDNLFENKWKKFTNIKTWREEITSNFYNASLIINYLLKQINPNLEWLDDLENLFNDFPWLKEQIWFDENWKNQF